MSVAATRRAFTIVELCAAAAMLTAALSLALATLSAMAKQRQAAELRQHAMEMAENVLERSTNVPWRELTTERLARLGAETNAERQLPEGQLELGLTEQSGPPAAKRIALELSWRPGATKDRRTLRLATWIYRQGGADE